MNQKIERTITEIEKTKVKVAKYQAKLRALEQQKVDYENEEIIAMFRKEKLTEGDLAAYIKSIRGAETDGQEDSPPASKPNKEDGAVEV